ncbi:hypothetical protein HI914_00697 [Erysiphe necator]|nr:hypothetical protein HI914_00697 [Erysiphe necator]
MGMRELIKSRRSPKDRAVQWLRAFVGATPPLESDSNLFENRKDMLAQQMVFSHNIKQDT